MICAIALGILALSSAIQDNSPPLAQETVNALVGSGSYTYLINPFIAQTGTQLSLTSIPSNIVARSAAALAVCPSASLRPPAGTLNFVGFRKAPSFQDEFMWLTWCADGRRIRWSDLDPQSFMLVELKTGELQSTDDGQHNADVAAWVRSHFQYTAQCGALTPQIIKKLPLPSGKTLWVGTIVCRDLEALIPNVPLPLDWATGIHYWTDGTVIGLMFYFPTLRPDEAGSPKGPASPRSSSRFDKPTLTPTYAWPIVARMRKE